MRRVEDKVVIVTGAGSERGIGFATAARLAQEGAHVVLTDIDGDGVLNSARQLAQRGYPALGLAHDVTRESDWSKVMDAAEATYGRVDALVNNAGIVLAGALTELPAEHFGRVVDINLTGCFLGAQAAVRAMRKHAGGGCVVNVSSVAGLVGYARLAAYNASKGGVRLLTKSIAVECASENIRCNSVHPGKIWTGMLEARGQARPDPDSLKDDIPLGYLGDPSDIANAILFLVSDEGRYITGAELVVDGGLTAQ